MALVSDVQYSYSYAYILFPIFPIKCYHKVLNMILHAIQ